MAQAPGRPCPTCGTLVPGDQRFCSNCGTDLYSRPQPGPYGRQPSPPPPPPYAQPYPPLQPYQYQQPPQQQNFLAELLGALGLLFLLRRYRPGYTPRRQSSGCCGCIVTLVVLLIIFGIPGYILFKSSSPRVTSQFQHSTGSNGGAATQQPITTVTLNESVPYAGITMTVVSVQQGSAFPDDTSINTPGAVRLNLKEAVGDKVGIFAYSDVARLILPDKSVISPSNAQFGVSPSANTTRNNWLDFAVATNVKTDQLLLQLGTSEEAQIIIPLKPGADLRPFQAVTVPLNAATQYAGLTWTITSATRAWSYAGRQAPRGMRYIVLTMKVDNPTTRDFIAYYGDYQLLKAGDVTQPPESSSQFPTSFAPGSSGTTGTIAFLAPQGTTAYTLVFQAQPNNVPPVNQATLAFQIP